MNLLEAKICIRTLDKQTGMMIEKDHLLFSGQERHTSLDDGLLQKVVFTLSTEIAPFLTEIKGNAAFAQFLHHHIVKLKKSRTMKLYEWCRLVQ